MENTNEILEENALDSSVFEEAESLVETLGGNAETEEVEREKVATDAVSADSVTEDDATMKLLKRFPKVCARIAELMNERAESVALDIIGKGLDFENAVANADKEGYVRGKNEKIELVKGGCMPRFEAENDDEETMGTLSRTQFPRYEKRSVWD